jgi:hypothetical protein
MHSREDHDLVAIEVQCGVQVWILAGPETTMKQWEDAITQVAQSLKSHQPSGLSKVFYTYFLIF